MLMMFVFCGTTWFIALLSKAGRAIGFPHWNSTRLRVFYMCDRLSINLLVIREYDAITTINDEHAKNLTWRPNFDIDNYLDETLIGFRYQNIYFSQHHLTANGFLVTGGGHFTGVGIPIPIALPTFGVLPFCLLRRHFRLRRRMRLGLCRNCGYDVRASTSRCPECGLACNLDPVSDDKI